jgi:hypothetical protein
MIAEISAGLGSLKAATDLLKGLNAAYTQAQINEVKLALQERLFDAQSALSAAQAAHLEVTERVRALEQQIVKLEDWKREKQRYQLEAVDVGAFAYTAKPGMENGEPPHWLCATCFEKGQRSILQFKTTWSGSGGMGLQAIWNRGTCENPISTFFQKKPQPKS